MSIIGILPNFPSFFLVQLNFPFSLPFKTCHAGSIILLLAGYYGTMPVFFSVSSTYHVTSLGDHSIQIIPAEDTIKIILRVQKQTVTHLHNSLPMDNGDQTWLHIDHKQNNALTWWVSVAVGEIYWRNHKTTSNLWTTTTTKTKE